MHGRTCLPTHGWMDRRTNGWTHENTHTRTHTHLTSNGGCRREEKSRKHWSLFTMLLSSVTEIFFLLDQKQLHVLAALKIREK